MGNSASLLITTLSLAAFFLLILVLIQHSKNWIPHSSLKIELEDNKPIDVLFTPETRGPVMATYRIVRYMINTAIGFDLLNPGTKLSYLQYRNYLEKGWARPYIVICERKSASACVAHRWRKDIILGAECSLPCGVDFESMSVALGKALGVKSVAIDASKFCLSPKFTSELKKLYTTR
jgi:hypothetical protein